MQNLESFEIQTRGKWILAGEHSVLRGQPALVFPLLSRGLELSFINSNQALDVEFDGAHGEEFQLLFFGVLEKACQLAKINRAQLQGTVKLKSTIPVGAGLGASAALCVAVARWFQAQKYLIESEIYEFSRSLENLFHGESSGVDIAVAISNQGLIFKRPSTREPFKSAWQPKLFISYSGQRGVTIDCVNQVKKLIQENPELGNQLDLKMGNATEKAIRALTQKESHDSFDMLKESILQASNCFEKWNLIPSLAQQHIDWLYSEGAIAVKPTGSGGGGYALSLWKQTPSESTLKKLISCF